MKNVFYCLFLSVFLYSCLKTTKSETPSAAPYKLKQTVYFGGNIQTIDGDTASYVEAVVVREGVIIYAGTKAEAMKRFKNKADFVDLKGKALSPDLLDSYSH